MVEAISPRSQKIVEWYERRLAPVAFVIGFIFDSITFTRVDFLFDHVILIGHLLIAASGIVLVNAYAQGRLREEFMARFVLFYPLAIQFSFGALFSGFTVLFVRSGSFAGSWLFLVFLALILVGNEFFRERYKRFIFHIGIYFVALFSYAIIAIPVLLRDIGPWIFVLSGIASILAIAFLAAILAFVAPAIIRENRFRLMGAIGGVYLLFNLFYFTNIIPPIPLVLKHLEIYHSLERLDNGKYRLEYEDAPWYRPWSGTDPIFRWVRGTKAIAFSAVFAPADINTKIVHRWLYYDEAAGAWVERNIIGFTMKGGRDTGYRGYSEKEAITPGKWRVEVRTERGELLGRTTFEVIETTAPPKLEVREL
ncbi:MAG: hypothetical protein UY60_C0015G0009 [Parcubacteria group bacterium GW2011_GWB1_50_9]|nr:MAG: hypothetical protein UY60_C0015G0009 [Parcubacteria group bacterium GW2011_GWB1_50_9]KKW33567.1 MAG: hypothetical protein UY78_C0008G0009 [Parcubacteria group bacterium GW2011_GWA1_53_13]